MNRDLIFQKYNNIKNNINRIKEKYNINYNIEIVAVSKYASLENIKEFLSLNLDLPLAESKAQSLRDRVGELEKFNKNLNIKWHFIGRIQSNKIKYIVKFSDLIQSVDSVEIAELINKEAQKNNKIQKNILIGGSLISLISVISLVISLGKIEVVIYNIISYSFIIILEILFNIERFNNKKNNVNEEFYIESQIFINMIMQIGRVIGYGLLFIIGLSNNIIYFKTLLLITTLIIPLYSYYMYQLHYK